MKLLQGTPDSPQHRFRRALQFELPDLVGGGAAMSVPVGPMNFFLFCNFLNDSSTTTLRVIYDGRLTSKSKDFLVSI